MFETELRDKLKRIFKVDKVSFDTPGASREQVVLWVELERARLNTTRPEMTGRVSGTAYIFARAEAIPFGFFAKQIARAPIADTKDFFWTDVEVSTKLGNNIVQRGFSFEYFFRGQWDPNVAKISDITVTVEET